MWGLWVLGGAFPYAYSPQIICAPCLKCDLHNYKKQLGWKSFIIFCLNFDQMNFVYIQKFHPIDFCFREFW
jgi:hypothetical protein